MSVTYAAANGLLLFAGSDCPLWRTCVQGVAAGPMQTSCGNTPERNAADGTVELKVGLTITRRTSSEKKKNVLPFSQLVPPSPKCGKSKGPPRVPPKSLYRSGTLLALPSA